MMEAWTHAAHVQGIYHSQQSLQSGCGSANQNAETFLPENPSSILPNVEKMPTSNLQEAVSWLSELSSRTERAIEGVLKMVDMKELGPTLVSCPFDSIHTMPPHFLFRHFLRCPSAPYAKKVDAARLFSSLAYLQNSQNDPDCKQSAAAGDSNAGSSYSTGAVATERTFDPSGARFAYTDCPAVVQGDPPKETEILPGCIQSQITTHREQSRSETENDRLLRKFLPSELWLLNKQVKDWTDVPTRYSFTVLKAVLALGTLDRTKVTDWLLAHSPRYGIVLDPVLATHIFVLVKFFAGAAVDEAMASLSANLDRKAWFVCSMFYEAGNWLTLKLSHLYQPGACRVFVVNLIKHLLLSSSQPLCVALKRVESSENDRRSPDVETESLVRQLELATQALHQRRELEDYLKAHSHFSKENLLQDYERLVITGAVIRSQRPNYRPVVEHDALVWHQKETQGSGQKNKSKEELLAEERDYKRRRMSYRGKKIRRTTTQVFHDIIDGHMKDIVAAGCFDDNQTSERSPINEKVARSTSNEAKARETDIQQHKNYSQHGYRKDNEVSNRKRSYDEVERKVSEGHRRSNDRHDSRSRDVNHHRYNSSNNSNSSDSQRRREDRRWRDDERWR